MVREVYMKKSRSHWAISPVQRLVQEGVISTQEDWLPAHRLEFAIRSLPPPPESPGPFSGNHGALGHDNLRHAVTGYQCWLRRPN